MTGAELLVPPPDGWTVDDLDAMPVSNYRCELTDGALSVSPSPSNLHQSVAAYLFVELARLAPEPYRIAQAVEVRFARQLTRIPDVLVVRSDQPGRHWFPPGEVLLAVEIESPGSHIEDRTVKPGLYSRFGIPHFWRIELDTQKMNVYDLGTGADYRLRSATDRVTVEEPFPVDLALADLLPRWA